MRWPSSFGARLRFGENVGEGVALVIGGARFLERAAGADAEDEGRGPGGDDERDGERLRPEPHEVTHEFAVECAHGPHQLTSAGVMRRSLTTVRATRPSAK